MEEKTCPHLHSGPEFFSTLIVVLSDNLVLKSGPGAPILRAPILCFLNQIFEPEIFFRQLPLAEPVPEVFKALPSHLPAETYHILAHAIRVDQLV